ncbi:MAG: precorrin-2 dehydrogenase/sirohydrochlorin ferrochelatase family protein [Candidatus Acidiferrales bacterium]
MKSLFPLFLKLEGRPCLVVGAGEIGESKIGSLLDAGGTVHVVAPHATGNVEEWAKDGKILWLRREFRETDLDGCFLVIAATPSTELHAKIFRLAGKRRILCNIVDMPELCDFYYPAVVRRGALQIAISTRGRSPALAQRLRKELEAQFGPEYEEWVAMLGEARERIRAEAKPLADQKILLHELASEESFKRFLERRKK